MVCLFLKFVLPYSCFICYDVLKYSESILESENVGFEYCYGSVYPHSNDTKVCLFYGLMD